MTSVRHDERLRKVVLETKSSHRNRDGFSDHYVVLLDQCTEKNIYSIELDKLQNGVKLPGKNKRKIEE